MVHIVQETSLWKSTWAIYYTFDGVAVDGLATQGAWVLVVMICI